MLNGLWWTALVVYLLLAVNHCHTERGKLTIGGVEIVIRDSAEIGIVSRAMVEQWLRSDGVEVKGRPVEEVNTQEIESFIRSRNFVRSADVYTDLRGTLHIRVAQRRPIARVHTSNGYSFYVTDDHYILSTQGNAPVYVPVITGRFTPPFARDFTGDFEAEGSEEQKKSSKSYQFFHKLITFVKLIESDDFWSSQIVQINVLGGADAVVDEWGRAEEAAGGRAADGQSRYREPDVEIVPRAGNHVVMLGKLDDAERKLDRLMLFYRNALDWEGWDSQRYINLKYENQIICTK